MGDPRPLFRDHVDRCLAYAEDALERSARAGAPFEGLVLHSGRSSTYHAQDRAVPFQPVPHFARLVPVGAPDQLLVVKPGTRPRLVQVRPRDFWYEPAPVPDHPFAEVFDVHAVEARAEAVAVLVDASRCAYVGDDPELARALGVPSAELEPASLTACLDWHRATKTDYEIECIREAARVAGMGHRAARERADDRASERQIHSAYLSESGLLEAETPYSNIVAWDDASAILHYQTKRSSAPEPGATFLIDAGGTHLGYASDVTRTYAYPHAHPVFREALVAMEQLQRDLVDAVRPGVGFVTLHERAVRGVCEILQTLGILRVDTDEAIDGGIAYAFLPHGLGHHLGLQVHDVGGQQSGPEGGVSPPPARYPHLRTTRPLEPGHVITIEPGLYFIPLLLEPLRSGAGRTALDWDLVDALVPSGGIRIEDDVRVTSDGGEDLSRPFTPAARTLRD